MHAPARTLRAAQWATRRMTQRWRHLPSFIIIGAPRTGTTSLYGALCEHREIGASFRKEVHFFDGRSDRGLEWYRASFPLRIGPGAPRITGEATPNYFAHPGAAEATALALPDVRLIALLRDPIERAHSAWRLKVFQGHEHRSFSEVIRLEAQQSLRFAERRSWQSQSELRDKDFFYLEKSRYAEHIERWLDVFPSDQLLVVKSEELFDEPETWLTEIFEFIGVDPSLAPGLPHHHAAPPADIEASDRQWLEAYFAPYNRKLTDLTGLTFE